MYVLMCEVLVSLTTLIFHLAHLQYPVYPYAMLHVAFTLGLTRLNLFNMLLHTAPQDS